MEHADWMNDEWKAQVLMYLDALARSVFKDGEWTLDGERNFPSPAEYVCLIFDDMAIGALRGTGEIFSSKTHAVLGQLSARIDATDFTRPMEQLLTSSEWHEIQALALKSIEAIKSDTGPEKATSGEQD